MVLDRNTILSQLEAGNIFKSGTWDKNSVKEASYALRMAHVFCMVDGKWYEANERKESEPIIVTPGKIAILSTIERFDMPGNLVGKLGMRLKFAAQGLTGLWGIQVDPWYGHGMEHDRLYVRVANLGNENIIIQTGNELVSIEFHELAAPLSATIDPKPSTWLRLRNVGAGQSRDSWSYVTRVESEVREHKDEMEKRLQIEARNIRDNLQPVVMFGVFLVAATLLGATVAILLGFQDTPEIAVPGWMTNWGWAVLMVLLSLAAVATATIGISTAWRFWQLKDRNH